MVQTVNPKCLLTLSKEKILEMICEEKEPHPQEDFYVSVYSSEDGYYFCLDLCAYGPFETMTDIMAFMCRKICQQEKERFAVYDSIKKILGMIESQT